jgi:diguanylate cyclase (GGDEF)-like protein
VSALILAVSIIETSYSLAYQDELTSLPSRRAFNDAQLRLSAPYSIAMVDIDHFKRVNDTYGHDIGDQVLRMVAAKLARVSGAGQAFRCGGEEFAILFSGKTTKEVLSHLEDLRVAIGSAELRMRGADRRLEARGPDRRNQNSRGRAKGQAIRDLAHPDGSVLLAVTVSIGVACSDEKLSHVEQVIQAADKALYRAKAGGRNRVETSVAPRARTRAKATRSIA